MPIVATKRAKRRATPGERRLHFQWANHRFTEWLLEHPAATADERFHARSLFAREWKDLPLRQQTEFWALQVPAADEEAEDAEGDEAISA